MMYDVTTAVMKVAGSEAIQCGFAFLYRYVAEVQSTMVASVWFDQAKYLQMMVKSMNVNEIPTANKGIAIAKRLMIFSCLMLNASAITSLALLNAVSPDVIGAATTPRTAKIPPNVPSKVVEISFTTTAAAPALASAAVLP